MTQNKKFKKAVRARMAETGERYTAARRALERQCGNPVPKHYETVKRICREIHGRTVFNSYIATDDPGYRELVSLGREGVPALLRRIEDCYTTERYYDGMAVWEPIAALYAVTQADPVPEEHAGKLEAIIEDWLWWGREEGHEW